MKKFQATKTSISFVSSVIIALVALVILFSPNTIFEIFSVSFVTVLGFVGFWFLLPFIVLLCVFSVFNTRFFKLKSGKYVVAIILVFLAVLIFLSISPDLTIQNAFDKYNQMLNSIEKRNIYLNTSLGGGYVGFCFAGLLNSLITNIGTIIFCGLLCLIAFLIVFIKPLISLFKIIDKKLKIAKQNKKESKTQVDENVKNSEKEKSPISQPSETNQTKKTSVYIPNSSETMKKARFEFTNAAPSKKEKSDDQNSFQKAFLDEIETKEDATKTEEAVSPENEQPNIESYDSKSSEDASIISNVETIVVDEPIDESIEAKAVEEPVDELHRQQPKAHLDVNYIYPSIDLLERHENSDDLSINEASCAERTRIINETFSNFRVGASVVGHTVGPSVTRYDIKTNFDVSVNTVGRYIEDLSVRLGGLRVRFETIVYGKATSGLEVPNEKRTMVGLREAIESLEFENKTIRYIPFGKGISGNLLSADMSEFPHMLVSGTTGSGKTIFIHSTIITLLMRNKPEELKILLIDPKKVEMNFYEEIPHLLCPNISDPFKAYAAMKKLVDEMERRYNLFQANRVRDIKGFNKWAKDHEIQPLPFIAVFVDEYADLVDSCKEIREPVVRLAQKARAAGIHLILATQRPSVNVIDGVIKGNIATRVALLSASATDSCTIIGEGGAEKLLGNGDMLVESALLSTCGRPRVQGCYVSVEEINAVCDFLRNSYGPQYDSNFLNLNAKPQNKGDDIEVVQIDKEATEEAQYAQIKEQIVHREYCSISYIQRSFGLGFPKAGRIFAKLVSEGIVDGSGGDHNGSKVLVYKPSEQQIGSVDQSTYYPDEK